MHVVLDTGSSDLWVADNQCTNCDNTTPVFQTSQSSSFQTSSGQDARVQLVYGSGQASGLIAKDTVTMSGFTVQQQVFGSFSLLVLRCLTHTLDSFSRQYFTEFPSGN